MKKLIALILALTAFACAKHENAMVYCSLGQATIQKEDVEVRDIGHGELEIRDPKSGERAIVPSGLCLRFYSEK